MIQKVAARENIKGKRQKENQNIGVKEKMMIHQMEAGLHLEVYQGKKRNENIKSLSLEEKVAVNPGLRTVHKGLMRAHQKAVQRPNLQNEGEEERKGVKARTKAEEEIGEGRGVKNQIMILNSLYSEEEKLALKKT